MKENLITVLQIMPGPVYDVDARLSKKLNHLSAFSRGTVVGAENNNYVITFGQYKVVLLGRAYLSKIRGSLRLFAAAFREAKLLKRKFGLDLIVCYDPLKTGVFGYILKKIFKCKLLIEINGVYNSPAIYEYYGSGGIVKKYFYPKIQQYILCRADALKCLFDGQLTGFKIPANVIVENYFDYTQIETSNYEAKHSQVVLCIGFPVFIKGMDLLIKVFTDLNSEFSGWKLWLVGWFSDQEQVYMQDLIGSNKNIDIKMPVNFTDIPELFDQCEIFTLPSRTEAMGRVLLEAMARGKARIGSRIDGIPTVIDHDKDGLLFEPGNMEDLKQKLETLMSSEPTRRRLALAGLKRFSREFTIDQYSQHVNALYKKILNTV